MDRESKTTTDCYRGSCDGRWNALVSDGSFTMHRTGATKEEAIRNAEAAWQARKQ